MEEIAVLNYLKEKPNATQKEVDNAKATLEKAIAGLQASERGIIERKNGRRNGFWEIKK